MLPTITKSTVYQLLGGGKVKDPKSFAFILGQIGMNQCLWDQLEHWGCIRMSSCCAVSYTINQWSPQYWQQKWEVRIRFCSLLLLYILHELRNQFDIHHLSVFVTNISKWCFCTYLHMCVKYLAPTFSRILYIWTRS